MILSKNLERLVERRRTGVEAVLEAYSWDKKLAPLIVPLLYNIKEPSVEEKMKKIKILVGNADTARITKVYVTCKPEVVGKRRKRKKIRRY